VPAPHTATDATRGLSAPARAGIAAGGTALGLVFEGVSRLRSAKSLHPRGAVFAGELRIDGGGPLALLAGVPFLSEPATHRGLVRFSRSLGLPEASPDILGMAIRLTDAHGPGRPQDLLLVTSGDGAVVHHVFVPSRGFYARPYSSVLVFRGEGDAFVVGARLAPGSARETGHGSELADLTASAATGRLRFDLGVAPLSGRMRPVATLTVGARLPDDRAEPRFNPWNTGGGLEPTGPVNRMRQSVYPRSQRGWVTGR